MDAEPESLFEATKRLIHALQLHYGAEEREEILAAFAAAAELHGEERRRNGALYLAHLTEVAALIAEAGCDLDTVQAAFLHDCLEGGTEAEDLKKRFGDDVYHLVEAVTKQPMFSKKEYHEKLYAKSRQDPRVAAIKLADAYANNQGNSQAVFSLEKHLEHIEELTYYIEYLAPIPEVPKEIVKMASKALVESQALYDSRNR